VAGDDGGGFFTGVAPFRGNIEILSKSPQIWLGFPVQLTEQEASVRGPLVCQNIELPQKQAFPDSAPAREYPAALQASTQVLIVAFDQPVYAVYGRVLEGYSESL